MERRRAIIVAAALIALAAFVGLAITLNRNDPKDEKRASPQPPNEASRPNAPTTPLDSVPVVIEPQELADAHKVMHAYLTTVGTYTYRTDSTAWTVKARALTDGSKNMTDQTTLPTGTAWAECEKTMCSSTATAELQRDTILSNAPVEGAGRSVTTLATTTVVLHQDQDQETTQSTSFQVTATYTSGEWRVSGLQLAGVGDAGTAETN
ncbi:hypothetical protein [Streptomyces sp. NPDC054865]